MMITESWTKFVLFIVLRDIGRIESSSISLDYLFLIIIIIFRNNRISVLARAIDIIIEGGRELLINIFICVD